MLTKAKAPKPSLFPNGPIFSVVVALIFIWFKFKFNNLEMFNFIFFWYFEKKYPNAFGIIFDDIIAAGYTLLAIYIINNII